MTTQQTNDFSAPAARSQYGRPPRTSTPGEPAAAGTWYKPDRVFVETELPHLTISRALNAKDDVAIWRGHRSARDPSMYLDWLALIAGRHSRQCPHFRDPTRETTWEHMLFAVPFLLPPEKWSVAEAEPAAVAAAPPLLQHLQDWVRQPQAAAVLPGTLPYLELCRWSPLRQRELLEDLAGQRSFPESPLSPVHASLGEGFPELAFVIGSVKRWLAPPELPEPGLSGHDEWELLSQLAARLAFVHHRPVQPQDVLLPTFFAEAVLEGLRMWVAEVSRRRLIRGWQVHAGQDDLVLLELTCARPDSAPSFLPIRIHQVRLAGLELLLMDLQREFGPPLAGAPDA